MPSTAGNKRQPEAIIISDTGLSARGKVGGEEIDAVTFENGQAEIGRASWSL